MERTNICGATHRIFVLIETDSPSLWTRDLSDPSNGEDAAGKGSDADYKADDYTNPAGQKETKERRSYCENDYREEGRFSQYSRALVHERTPAAARMP